MQPLQKLVSNLVASQNPRRKKTMQSKTGGLHDDKFFVAESAALYFIRLYSIWAPFFLQKKKQRKYSQIVGSKHTVRFKVFILVPQADTTYHVPHCCQANSASGSQVLNASFLAPW